MITFHDPPFAPGLHGEGGAMRIPADHYLLRKYIKDFGLRSQLFDFEMENKFIYLSGYDGAKTLTYTEFNHLSPVGIRNFSLYSRISERKKRGRRAMSSSPKRCRLLSTSSGPPTIVLSEQTSPRKSNLPTRQSQTLTTSIACAPSSWRLPIGVWMP